MSWGGPPQPGYAGYGGPAPPGGYQQHSQQAPNSNMYHNQQQYGPPQGQYHHQPPQGQWQQPPPQGYPPQGPPGQWHQQGPPLPPHPNQGGHYGAPPVPAHPNQAGHYGGPPVPPHPNQGHNVGYHAPPPPQHPPHQQYGGPAPGHQAPPSLGYDPHMVANVDTSRDADGLRAAMKGFGTDEKALIQILAVQVPDPAIMASLRQTYAQRHRRDLVKDVEKETSGYFEEGLVALIRGPLEQDIFNLHDALAGAGTKEDVLNDILLGRSNADINAIKTAYHRKYNRTLEADVKGDLSLKTERMFDLVLSAQRADESTPVIPHQLDHDVSELHRATEGKVGTAQITVCEIFAHRSDGQLRAISDEYQRRYQRPLRDVIIKEFSGHMEDALLRQLDCGVDRAMADAESLEATMKGMGTKDRLLVNRLVRLHWNKPHMQQVNAAYQHRYKKELWRRIEGETRGDYKRLAVALANPNAVV